MTPPVKGQVWPHNKGAVRSSQTILRACVVVAAVLAGTTMQAMNLAGAPAQPNDPGSTFRVFLHTGQALVSYGESALLDDRVVFTLVVGDGSPATRYQLVSLPAAAVDLARTAQYAYAMRAARYAATRGETDYTAVTAEVTRALDEVAKVSDPKTRLDMAEEARRRLLKWSRENYGYRAKDIEELAGLFEEVIAEMRIAAGESQFSIDLVAGPAVARVEPLRPMPTFREAIEQALFAASVADTAPDRIAILRAAADSLTALQYGDPLGDDVQRRLAAALDLDRRYAELSASVLARADEAVKRGDVPGVDRARRDFLAGDQALGAARPMDVKVTLAALDSRAERARARDAELGGYAARRPALLAYEKAIRPLVRVLDGSTPTLDTIRNATGSSLELARTHRSQLEESPAADDEGEGARGTVGCALDLRQRPPDGARGVPPPARGTGDEGRDSHRRGVGRGVRRDHADEPCAQGFAGAPVWPRGTVNILLAVSRCNDARLSAFQICPRFATRLSPLRAMATR